MEITIKKDIYVFGTRLPSGTVMTFAQNDLFSDKEFINARMQGKHSVHDIPIIPELFGRTVEEFLKEANKLNN